MRPLELPGRARASDEVQIAVAVPARTIREQSPPPPPPPELKVHPRPCTPGGTVIPEGEPPRTPTPTFGSPAQDALGYGQRGLSNLYVHPPESIEQPTVALGASFDMGVSGGTCPVELALVCHALHLPIKVWIRWALRGLGDVEETHSCQGTGHGGVCPPCPSQVWRTRASQPQIG